MRHFQLSIVLAILLFSAGTTRAQLVSDPTRWKYEVKKTGENKYRLIFHLKLEKTWHIWSLNPGFDGSLVPPSFKFDKKPGVKLIGSIKEQGKKQSHVEIEGEPHSFFFEDKVDYAQDISVAGNVKITGKRTYQVCDDKQCLLPKTASFEFNVP